MINFIVCEDQIHTKNNIVTIINTVMMGTKTDYKIFDFSSYNADFKKIMNRTLENKVYILDIEVEDKSGIDIATNIRENDWESIIIFLTVHDYLMRDTIKKRLMVLNFISKFDNYSVQLRDTIKTAIKILDIGPKITFKSKGTVYSIKFDDINYIVKEMNKRTICINAKGTDYIMLSTLIKLKKQLPKSFIQTHKAAIVNTDKIESIDFKNKIILFKDGNKLDLISKNYKKEVSKYVCS